jgi:TM2 domain-containing membrane protein YozV
VANVLNYIPDADPEEIGYLNMLMSPMTEQQAQQFAMMYRHRRKESSMILILALVGFLGFAGIHRFVVGNIAIGVLYMLTGGVCGIGTFIDLVNHRKITSEYNQTQAYEVASTMRMLGQL